MPLRRAQILCPWVAAPTSGAGRPANVPHVAQAYPGVKKVEDVTGQSAPLPPVPNTVVVEIEAEEAVLDQIAADPLCSILSEEPA